MNKLFLLALLSCSAAFAGVRIINMADKPITFKYLYSPLLGKEAWSKELGPINTKDDVWNTEDWAVHKKLRYQVFADGEKVLDERVGEAGNQVVTIDNKDGKWTIKKRLGDIEGR